MIHDIGRIGLTLCRDGTMVSTISCVGLGQIGGDYETCLIGPLVDGRRSYSDVQRYETAAQANAGHARYVREHGGAAGLMQRLLTD